MSISVIGAGAFGTALAIALAQGGRDVTLWGRDCADMVKTRENTKRLAGIKIPERVVITPDLPAACAAQTLLLAVPAQTLHGFALEHADLMAGKRLVACCKGINTAHLTGPVASLRHAVPDATAAILTGPSFAADIARGLPTALTLACADHDAGAQLQHSLATPALRLYLSTDTAGAELGGALKNVIAIASGAVMGAGLGDSARAALMTRGFAEMQRFAPLMGADHDTLSGLSGLGDLALTCTSDLSRNYRFGYAMGQGQTPDIGATVEGVATAVAVASLAKQNGIDMPICAIVARMGAGELTVAQALQHLMSRPLKDE